MVKGDKGWFVNTKTVDGILNLAEVLNNANNGISLLNNDLFALFEYKKIFGDVTKEDIDSIRDVLLKAINNHNMFIAKSKPHKREMIIKNFIVNLLYDIILDPVNQILAQSSVDSITDDAKSMASLSPAAAKSRLMCPGNFCTKFVNMNDNMVGKDGIAICATGLKTFFALSNVANAVQLESNNTDVLSFNVTIGGKRYSKLSNIYLEKILDYVRKFGFDGNIDNDTIEYFLGSDAALQMSAFLGLSADNAKELALGKLNANTDTLGMYLFAFSLGMDVTLVAPIMMSKLALTLSSMCKGNLFQGELGSTGIIAAILYILEGPKNLAKFEKLNYPPVRQTIVNCLKSNQFDTLTDILQNLENPINPVTIFTSPEYTLATVALQSKESLQIFKQQILLAVSFLNDYITKVKPLRNDPNMADIVELAFGAEEMKTIGLMLRLNQEIKTDSVALYTLVSKIADCIPTTLNRIKRYNAIMKMLGMESKYAVQADAITSLSNQLKTPPFKYLTDFEYFIKDGSAMVYLMDLLKFAYNPLRIFKLAKNYKGYAESLYITHKGMSNKSVRYRMSSRMASNYCSAKSIYDPKLKELVFANIERFIALLLTNYSLLDIKIHAIKGQNVFNPETLLLAPTTTEYDYNLGTETGLANFKLLMEDLIIPYLKKSYPNNKFILGLLLNVSDSNLRGVISMCYGLNINMIPKRGTYEEDLFNEMKDSFNQLKREKALQIGGPKGTLMTILDLFYLYSLCAYQNKVGPRNLTGIFTDYIENGDGISKQIIAKLAVGERNAKIDEYNLPDEILAPLVTSVYRDGSDVLRVRDALTQQIIMYYDKKPLNDKDNVFGDYNPEEEVETIPVANKNYEMRFTKVRSTNHFLLGMDIGLNNDTINTIADGINVSYNKNNKLFTLFAQDNAISKELLDNITLELNGNVETIILTDGVGVPYMQEDYIVDIINRIKNNCSK